MVSQIKPVLCPKCKKSVLGIERHFGGKKTLAEVTVHHHEDVTRVNAGHTAAVCVFKMTWQDSQDLANSITRDIGGRK